MSIRSIRIGLLCLFIYSSTAAYWAHWEGEKIVILIVLRRVLCVYPTMSHSACDMRNVPNARFWADMRKEPPAKNAFSARCNVKCVNATTKYTNMQNYANINRIQLYSETLIKCSSLRDPIKFDRLCCVVMPTNATNGLWTTRKMLEKNGCVRRNPNLILYGANNVCSRILHWWKITN